MRLGRVDGCTSRATGGALPYWGQVTCPLARPRPALQSACLLWTIRPTSLCACCWAAAGPRLLVCLRPTACFVLDALHHSKTPAKRQACQHASMPAAPGPPP